VARAAEKYPPFQTCRRRFQNWIRSGKLEQALKLLAAHLHAQGKLNLEEAFVDATFASAKKGASPLAPSKALRLPSASLWKRFLSEASSTNSRRG
jgi:hypothetical protein